MKLVFILPVDILSHLSGGVQKITLNLRNYLLQFGFEIDVLVLQKESEFSVNETFIKRIEPSETSDDEIMSFIKNGQYHKVINQFGFSYNLTIERIHLELGIPIITVNHQCIWCLFDRYSNNLRINYNESNSKLRRILAMLMHFRIVDGLIGFIGKKKLKREYQRVFNYSHRVVIFFDDFKNELLDLFGKSIQNDSKILVIPNILGDEFSQMENVDFSIKEKLIIYVGRIENQQKRVDKLFEFWEAFSAINQEYRLEILGNGPKFDFYKELINSKKLERINLVGNVNPKPYYQKATFLVLFSDYEGHALVLTEAQKNGCIPISFRCYSAIDRVIQHGLNGIIVEEFSVNKMVGVFEELTNDQTKITNLQNTVQSVGDFSYPKDIEIVTKWQNLINE